jgi:hypothetical protein
MPGDTEELEGDSLLELLIGPLGEIHRSHSALGDVPNHPEAPHAVARGELGRGRFRCFIQGREQGGRQLPDGLGPAFGSVEARLAVVELQESDRFGA